MKSKLIAIVLFLVGLGILVVIGAGTLRVRAGDLQFESGNRGAAFADWRMSREEYTKLRRLKQIPDPELTPGSVMPGMTKEIVCNQPTSERRKVSTARKRKVYELHGIDKRSDRYEVDHLIPLSIGGSNEIDNLWPQSQTALPYNGVGKRIIDNGIQDLVCSGKVPLEQAQRDMARNWVEACNKYIAQGCQIF